MSSFTCLACRVAFADAMGQRSHYKTDWHRYNLKRQMAELPPVTAEGFQERVLTLRSQQAEEEAVAAADSGRRYCQLCRKKFASQNALGSHLRSKKHAAAVLQKEQSNRLRSEEEPLLDMLQDLSVDDSRPQLPTVSRLAAEISEEEEELEEDDDEEWSDLEVEPLSLEACLFCSHHSNDPVQNVRHMMGEHSFFIPDLDYLVDPVGLMTHLAEKVGVGNMCLWCNDRGKMFHSLNSVQQHMRDLNHCKINYERDTRVEFTAYYDYTKSYPEWDTRGPNDVVEPAEYLDGSGYELTLPSGSTIGHRSLLVYYRQKLRPLRPKKDPVALRAAAFRYRTVGWSGTSGLAAARKARDLKMMLLHRAKRMVKLGTNNNRLQRYFRRQNPI